MIDNIDNVQKIHFEILGSIAELKKITKTLCYYTSTSKLIKYNTIINNINNNLTNNINNNLTDNNICNQFVNIFRIYNKILDLDNFMINIYTNKHSIMAYEQFVNLMRDVEKYIDSNIININDDIRNITITLVQDIYKKYCIILYNDLGTHKQYSDESKDISIYILRIMTCILTNKILYKFDLIKIYEPLKIEKLEYILHSLSQFVFDNNFLILKEYILNNNQFLFKINIGIQLNINTYYDLENSLIIGHVYNKYNGISNFLKLFHYIFFTNNNTNINDLTMTNNYDVIRSLYDYAINKNIDTIIDENMSIKDNVLINEKLSHFIYKHIDKYNQCCFLRLFLKNSNINNLKDIIKKNKKNKKNKKRIHKINQCVVYLFFITINVNLSIFINNTTFDKSILYSNIYHKKNNNKNELIRSIRINNISSKNIENNENNENIEDIEIKSDYSEIFKILLSYYDSKNDKLRFSMNDNFNYELIEYIFDIQFIDQTLFPRNKFKPLVSNYILSEKKNCVYIEEFLVFIPMINKIIDSFVFDINDIYLSEYVLYLSMYIYCVYNKLYNLSHIYNSIANKIIELHVYEQLDKLHDFIDKDTPINDIIIENLDKYICSYCILYILYNRTKLYIGNNREDYEEEKNVTKKREQFDIINFFSKRNNKTFINKLTQLIYDRKVLIDIINKHTSSSTQKIKLVNTNLESYILTIEYTNKNKYFDKKINLYLDNNNQLVKYSGFHKSMEFNINFKKTSEINFNTHNNKTIIKIPFYLFLYIININDKNINDKISFIKQNKHLIESFYLKSNNNLLLQKINEQYFNTLFHSVNIFDIEIVCEYENNNRYNKYIYIKVLDNFIIDIYSNLDNLNNLDNLDDLIVVSNSMRYSINKNTILYIDNNLFMFSDIKQYNFMLLDKNNIQYTDITTIYRIQIYYCYIEDVNAVKNIINSNFFKDSFINNIQLYLNYEQIFELLEQHDGYSKICLKIMVDIISYTQGNYKKYYYKQGGLLSKIKEINHYDIQYLSPDNITKTKLVKHKCVSLIYMNFLKTITFYVHNSNMTKKQKSDLMLFLDAANTTFDEIIKSEGVYLRWNHFKLVLLRIYIDIHKIDMETLQNNKYLDDQFFKNQTESENKEEIINFLYTKQPQNKFMMMLNKTQQISRRYD